jgi:hypothetical protein
MTVKDYLKIHDGDDIRSVGVYKAHINENENSDTIDAHVKAVDIIKYEDLEIDHVHLWIYDEFDKDIYGNPINLKHIRACIYVK